MNVNKKHFKVANQATMTADNTIVILGPAEDGPSRMPIVINSDLDPIDVFGRSPLADAYTAVRSTGAKQIVAYRINGSHANATIRHVHSTGGLDIIRLISTSANNQYNKILVKVYPDYIYIDEREIGGSTRSYFFETYPTAHDVAYAINRDAFYGLISFTAETLEDDFLMSEVVTGETIVYFSGGESEEEFLLERSEDNDPSYLVRNMKARLIEDLFGPDPDDQANYSPNSSLGLLPFSVILVAGVYHDDDPEITKMLNSFSMSKTRLMDSGCLGVIGTKPVFNTENIADKVNALISLSTAEDMPYVQVVVGDAYYNSRMNRVSTAYGYAGVQSFHPYYTIMTNKEITGFGRLNYQISKEDIDLLSSNGYTCIVPSIRRGFVPYLASTHMKDKKSPMSKPHCIRISQYVSRRLSEEYDYLIGSVSDFTTRKEIVATAEEILQKMVESDIIRSFTVRCEFSPGNREATIDVSLTPYSEITVVNTSTTVAFPREVL